MRASKYSQHGLFDPGGIAALPTCQPSRRLSEPAKIALAPHLSEARPHSLCRGLINAGRCGDQIADIIKG
jgi:hypothetical protein